MANISAIKLPDGNTYNIVDKVSKDVFIADYEYTTYGDIFSALYDDEKSIICRFQSDDEQLVFLPLLIHYGDTLFRFGTLINDGVNNILYICDVDDNDAWGYDTIDIATIDVATTSTDGLMSSSDKTKLNGIASGAEVNVQSDWNQATSTADDYIKNKPTIPTNVSDLNNDSGFITTEADPTVPSWAKQSTKPTYTATEVGALPNTTVIPSKTSDLTNDSGFITTNYVSNITRNYEQIREDPPTAVIKSATLTYGGSQQIELIADSDKGVKNGVCELDSSSKIPISRIPSGYANVQSNWNQSDSTADDYIKNKPTIPSQPSDIGAQETLISGTNIKTINNISLLGSGDLTVTGGTQVKLVRW